MRNLETHENRRGNLRKIKFAPKISRKQDHGEQEIMKWNRAWSSLLCNSLKYYKIVSSNCCFQVFCLVHFPTEQSLQDLFLQTVGILPRALYWGDLGLWGGGWGQGHLH